MQNRIHELEVELTQQRAAWEFERRNLVRQVANLCAVLDTYCISLEEAGIESYPLGDDSTPGFGNCDGQWESPTQWSAPSGWEGAPSQGVQLSNCRCLWCLRLAAVYARNVHRIACLVLGHMRSCRDHVNMRGRGIGHMVRMPLNIVLEF